jgi:hypothetical protein
MPEVYGARPVMDLFELPDHVAEELLADSMQGHYFVDWRPFPGDAPEAEEVDFSA